jgi:parvulin-like peptidyl-prolyl isomerase
MNGISTALKANPSKFDEYVLRASESAGYKAIPSLYLEKTQQSKSIFGDAFFNAAFQAKTGEITPVIQTPTGFRIVRVNEFIAQKQLTLSDPSSGNQNLTVQEFIAMQRCLGKRTDLPEQDGSRLDRQPPQRTTIKVYAENLTW